MPDNLIIAECLAMITILDEERLYAHWTWAVWYQRLVKAYCALEDKKNAKKWAEKAAKLARVFVAHDAGWDAVAKDPKNTDWWGRRTKTWGVGRTQKEESLGEFRFDRDMEPGFINLLPVFTAVNRPVL